MRQFLFNEYFLVGFGHSDGFLFYIADFDSYLLQSLVDGRFRDKSELLVNYRILDFHSNRRNPGRDNLKRRGPHH